MNLVNKTSTVTVAVVAALVALAVAARGSGAFYAQTPIGDCSSDPGTTNNDYVIAYDTVSGRWSNELPSDSDCASF